MNLIVRIVLILLALLVGLGIGLLLRRWLIRRLRKTVLDNWLIQTLGIIITLPTLLLAAASIPFILTGDFFFTTDLLGMLTSEQARWHGVVGAIWNILISVLVIILGIGVARTLIRLTNRNLGERVIDINLRALLGRIIYAIAFTIAIFWVLTFWNIQIGLPIALVGALLTLALQDILKDLVAGFYILIERPFHIGDEINASNYTGTVQNVQLRATKLRLLSGEEVVIPNALVFSGTVVNNTQYSEKRVGIVVTLAEENFLKDETPDQILQIIKELSMVLPKPEPSILVRSFTGAISGYTAAPGGYAGRTVSLTVYFWISSQNGPAVTEVMCALRAALPHADLAVA